MATYDQGNVRVAKDGTVTRLADRRVTKDGTRSLSESKYQEELKAGRIDPKKFEVGQASEQDAGGVMDLAQRGLLKTGDRVTGDINAPITSGNLTPASQINLPKPPTPSNLGTQTMTGLSGLTNVAGPDIKQADSDFKAYLKGIAKPQSSEKMYKQTEKEVGLLEKQRSVANFQAQLNAITTKAQADKLSLVGQGRGVSEVIIGGQQAKIDREAAIQALPVSAQLAAAQGDLEMAQSHLETLFKIRSEDAQNKLDYANKVNDAVYNYATEKQKAALDAKKTADERAYNMTMSNLNYLRDLQMTAIKNGQPSLAASLAGIDPASKNFESLVGSYASKIMVDQGGGSSGASNSPLGILDIARYNELYPDAGVTAGDSEATANAKVNATNSPEARLRSLISSFFAAGEPYDKVVSDIESSTQITDKATALAVAAEVYGQAGASSSAIEAEINQLSSNPNYSSEDVRELLLRRGYSPQEITASSIGSFGAKTMAGIDSLIDVLFPK